MRQKIREIPAKIDKNSRGRDWGPLAGAGILKITSPGPGPGKKHKSRPYPGPGPGSRSITGHDSVSLTPPLKGVHRQATEAFPVVEISKTLDFSSEESLNCFELNNFTLHVRRPQRTAVFQMRSYVQEHHDRYIPGDEGA